MTPPPAPPPAPPTAAPQPHRPHRRRRRRRPRRVLRRRPGAVPRPVRHRRVLRRRRHPRLPARLGRHPRRRHRARRRSTAGSRGCAAAASRSGSSRSRRAVPLGDRVQLVGARAVLPGRRRGRPARGASAGAAATGGDVARRRRRLADQGRAATRRPAPARPATPAWVRETRALDREARAAAASGCAAPCRSRSRPCARLVVTLVVLGLVDARPGSRSRCTSGSRPASSRSACSSGWPLRRTPWSVASLLVPAVIGLDRLRRQRRASLRDGIGQKRVAADDLARRALPAGVRPGRARPAHAAGADGPRDVRIDLGAGQVRSSRRRR